MKTACKVSPVTTPLVKGPRVMTGLVVRKVLEKVLPDRHSENRHPVLAEAVKEKVSPGLAEDGVEQSPGLEDGVQV